MEPFAKPTTSSKRPRGFTQENAESLGQLVITKSMELLTMESANKRPKIEHVGELTSLLVAVTDNQNTIDIREFDTVQESPPSVEDIEKSKDNELDIVNDLDIKVGPETFKKNFPKIWAFKQKIHGTLSDQAFTWCLARHLQCSRQSVTLKLSLLMSLASIDGESIPIPIAAIGHGFTHAKLIMSSIGMLADCFVSSSFVTAEGLSLINDDFETQKFYMEEDGVIFLDRCEKLQIQEIVGIQQEIGSAFSGYGPRCALWTSWPSSLSELVPLSPFIE